MTYFDVCNGDADGLCAVVQWRLKQPAAAQLITGLKRDIDLLERAQARPGDEVTVFDISMQRNRPALLRLLEAGVRVRYFDHHAVKDIPSHDLLDAHIDLASDVCTSLLVDRFLGGAQRAWALVGAYGDNLSSVADPLAAASGFSEEARGHLRRLGEVINYNAYGEEEGDVCVTPQRMHALMSRYADPLELLAAEQVIDEIDAVRLADLSQAHALAPAWQGPSGRVFIFPDAPWSRRVLGGVANDLANAEPELAHAVLKVDASGHYAVSVRAPLTQPMGADTLCSQFGGGGRARAAGINGLPQADLDRFIGAFAAAQWGGPAR